MIGYDTKYIEARPVACRPIWATVSREEYAGALAAITDLRRALGRLYRVLQAIGLIKPRHIPVLIAMIENLCADVDTVPAGRT